MTNEINSNNTDGSVQCTCDWGSGIRRPVWVRAGVVHRCLKHGMERCTELLGPFQCEKLQGHQGRCQFDEYPQQWAPKAEIVHSCDVGAIVKVYGDGEETNSSAAADGLARIMAFNRGKLYGIRRVKQMLLEMHFGPSLDAVSAKLQLLKAIEQYLSDADTKMPGDAEI